MPDIKTLVTRKLNDDEELTHPLLKIILSEQYKLRESIYKLEILILKSESELEKKILRLQGNITKIIIKSFLSLLTLITAIQAAFQWITR